nr:MAG TPA: hypothetical protein [Caudoviricetes sp.]
MRSSSTQSEAKEEKRREPQRNAKKGVGNA